MMKILKDHYSLIYNDYFKGNIYKYENVIFVIIGYYIYLKLNH